MPVAVSEPGPARRGRPASLVIDGSVAVAFALPDERAPSMPMALAWIAAGTSAHVPSHWALEVANAVLTAERRGRLSPAAAAECAALLASLPVKTDDETGARLRDTAALARRHRLTIYDAAYLELAVRRRAALATLDEALAVAARAEGLVVVA